MAALKGAIPLEQVNDIAMAVAEHLHLYVAGRSDPFLQQNFVVAETRARLALATFQRGLEICRIVHLSHALAAATGDGLDKHGIADLLSFAGQAGNRLVLPFIARRHRHASGAHELFRLVLQAHGRDALRFGPHPDQPGFDHRARELGVLRQKAVTGMDRFRAGLLRSLDNSCPVEIAFGSRRGTDMHGLVG